MSEWERYLYPGSNVLRNKPGIRDQAELQRFERGVTAVRIEELKNSRTGGDYGLEHMQSIHRQVFRDVYEWAGQVRTVDISKGPATDRTVFALKEDIHVKAELIKASIEDEAYFRGTDKKSFADKIGSVYASVNDLHPFRDGNGRMTREYMSQLAQESGRTLDYGKVDKAVWNDAAKQSARGNLEPIQRVFYVIAAVERAHAFEAATDREGQREALAKHPDLDAAFKRLHAVQIAGGDVAAERVAVARYLHAGTFKQEGVTVEESRKVIDHAAAYRGLMVREAQALGGSFNGQVVAVSSHHAMLKVGDMVAVRYETAKLSRPVHVGEKLAIQYGGELSQVRDAGSTHSRDQARGSKSFERERGLAGT